MTGDTTPLGLLALAGAIAWAGYGALVLWQGRRRG